MRNLGTLIFWGTVLALLPDVALAQEPGVAAEAASSLWGYGLGAGLAVGLVGLGCGVGQGLTAANTTSGIARNPGASGSMFVPYILGMVLIESIAIYGLVIAFQLVGKIPG